MTDRNALPPGLPSPEELKSYRIWDSYFTPAHGHPGRDGKELLISEVERSLPAIELGKIEKLCYFPHVGIGSSSDHQLEKLLQSKPELVTEPMRLWPGLFLGMIQLNSNDVPASLDALNRWIRDGEMLGVYFAGGGPGSLPCSHENFHPLVERIAELKGVIMQHTWFITGGKPKPGLSTPAELAELAGKYPEQSFVCAHAGVSGKRVSVPSVTHPMSSSRLPGLTPRRASSRWRFVSSVKIASSSAVICHPGHSARSWVKLWARKSPKGRRKRSSAKISGSCCERPVGKLTRKQPGRSR